MTFKFRFATFTESGVPRISFSREEILEMLLKLNRDEPADRNLIIFLEVLEKQLRP